MTMEGTRQQEATSPDEKAGPKRGATLFDWFEVQDQLIDDFHLANADDGRPRKELESYLTRKIWRQPLVRDENANLALSGFYVVPRVSIPAFSNPSDSIFIVVEGSVSHGQKILRPGMGFFYRANTRCELTAGASGVRVIQFGTREAVLENLLGPETTFLDAEVPAGDARSPGAPGSDESVYFDWSQGSDFPFPPLSNLADFPDAIRDGVPLDDYFDEMVFGQELPDDGRTNCTVVSTYLAPSFLLPRHRHLPEYITVVVEGSMSQGNRVFRPGCGYHNPPGTPYHIRSGPNGVRFLEFRSYDGHRLMNDGVDPGGGPNTGTFFVDANPEHWTLRNPTAGFHH